MRKAALVLTLMLVVAACSSMALADTYTVSGTYDSISTPTTAVSGPGETFSFVFTLPYGTSSDANGIYADVSAAFNLNGGSVLTGTPMTAAFYPNELDITFNAVNGNSYYWDLLVDGNVTDGTNLLLGTSPIVGGSLLALDSTVPDGVGFGTITGGSVTATPEPASFLLMGSGILALGGAIRRKLSL